MKPPFRLLALFWASILLVCLPAKSVRGANPPKLPGNPGTALGSGPSRRPDVTRVSIPGPLRSFLRMAGISQKVSEQEVLPLLARNVATEGYDWTGRNPRPTEYMILLKEYLDHARKLAALAGPQGIIRVSRCSEAQPLLAVLGYRLRQDCGPNATVETAKPKTAFLTIDSGFPLTALEATLQSDKPFVYPYPTSQVPVLLESRDWVKLEGALEKERRHKNKDKVNDVVGVLVSDPLVARLYWALARMDNTTLAYLGKSPGLKKLVPYAAALDFYGSSIYIQSGRVAVPGGRPAESGWKSLAGASPKNPKAFITHLLDMDEGWLAAYFDALARVSGARQVYFTEPQRLVRFYRALVGPNPYPAPARPIFRPDPGLLLLVSQLQFESAGQVHIPGNLAVWKQFVGSQRDSHSKIIRRWARQAGRWKNGDQVVACMFALSRASSEGGPLQAFMQLSEIDRKRSAKQRLDPQTAALLADKFSRYGDQYLTFSEFPTLTNASIARFLSIADEVDKIRDHTVRADAVGIFQANVGLWQILARQGQIPASDWNTSWLRVIDPFAGVDSSSQLFDAAQTSLQGLFQDAGGTLPLSQDKIILLLAGPSQNSSEGQRVREVLASRIRAALEAQRLVSLDTLLAPGGQQNTATQGKAVHPDMSQFAGQFQDLQMPRPLLMRRERTEWTDELYGNPHFLSETGANVSFIIKAESHPQELAGARGRLVPFLRDTLVGLNYAYYQPPGAQMLYDNPLFVRSHEFLGQNMMGGKQTWKVPVVFGRGWTQGSGAYLAGSLADLPYVLADVEQDFIVPENVQALIWSDLVPTLLESSVLPRWWGVTRNELHAVTLYQRFGEALITRAAKNDELRTRVINILSDRMLPERRDQIDADLRAGRDGQALFLLSPAELFYLAARVRQEFSSEIMKSGEAGQELEELSQRDPVETSTQRLSEDFGVPHPALSDTYRCELLDVKPFPTFLGYSSRLLAESWESNNLYWARLADEMGYSPVTLNLLAPELTRRMIAKIFATDLADRPALLRALRETGEDFRRGKVAPLTGGERASGN